MSLILKVTPEEVRTKAGEIGNQKSMMETYLQDMQGKMNQLQDAWQSPSGQAYIEKFNTLANTIRAALDDLQQHTTNLNDAASKYEEVETQQKNLVEQLNTDNIFG